VLLKKTYKIPLSAEKDKKSDFSIPGSVLGYILSKENGHINRTKEREKVFSKIQSTDTSKNGLQSTLFIRKSSDRIASQDESQRRHDSTSQVSRYVSE